MNRNENRLTRDDMQANIDMVFTQASARMLRENAAQQWANIAPAPQRKQPKTLLQRAIALWKGK